MKYSCTCVFLYDAGPRQRAGIMQKHACSHAGPGEPLIRAEPYAGNCVWIDFQKILESRDLLSAPWSAHARAGYTAVQKIVRYPPRTDPNINSSSFVHPRSLNVEGGRCCSRRRCLVSIGAVTEMACMLCGANTCCCPQLATCVKGSRHRPAVTVWMAPSRFGAPAPLGGAVAALTLRFQAL